MQNNNSESLNINDKSEQIIQRNTVENSIIENNEKNNMGKIYNLEDIITIFKKNNFPETIINKINKDIITAKDRESIYLFEVKKSKKKNKKKANDKDKENKDKNVMKKGRKLKDDDIIGIHKKESSDNIIKKCKAIFFSYLIEYIQNYLNKYKNNYKDEIRLLKLDYLKYINRLKKDIDLELLQKSLKDLASLETSSRYRSNNDKSWNKKIIQQVLEKEKDNVKINNLLNMHFGEWIDCFTYKNDFDDCFEFDGLQLALKNIAEKNDENYFSKLILYLYNYKRWFINKRGRNRDIKLEENKI